MNRTCSDCGARDVTVLLRTGYGQFCRRCAFPAEVAVKKRRKPKVDR